MADLMNNLNNSIYLSTGASLDNAYRSGMPQNAGMPGVSSENPRVENLKKAAGIETDAKAGDAERLTGGKECQTCKNRKIVRDTHFISNTLIVKVNNLFISINRIIEFNTC